MKTVLFFLGLLSSSFTFASITLTIKNNTNLPIEVSYNDDYCMYYPTSSTASFILYPGDSRTYGQADNMKFFNKCGWASHHHYRIRASLVIAPYIYVQRCVQAMGDISVFSQADECVDSSATNKLTMTRSGGSMIYYNGSRIESRGTVNINHST